MKRSFFRACMAGILFVLVPQITLALTQRANVDNFGNEGNADASYPIITSDGRYVIFMSTADNLVPTDFNGTQDVFMRDILSGTTTRISVDSSGNESDGRSNLAGSESVSINGQYIVFQSYGTNLVSGDTNGEADIFVRDVVNNTTIRASISSSGDEINNSIYYTSITPDGRYVLFYGYPDNLVPGDTNGQSDVFIRDILSGTTSMISVDSSGALSNGYSYALGMSDDARYIVFYSNADNLVPGDTNGQSDVFVRDMLSGTTFLASVDNSGNQGNNYSEAITISNDGRYILFYSDSDNLVPGDTNGQGDVFVRDIFSGTTTRASVDNNGNEGALYSWSDNMTPDGRYVLFYTESPSFFSGDTNGESDLFVRDVFSGITTHISVSSDEIPANDYSEGLAITPDGRYVVFASDASNLYPRDNNGQQDIFVRDIVLGTTTRASVNDGGQGGNDSSNSYIRNIINDSGDYVVFYSYASDLVPNDTNGSRDIFISQWKILLDPAPIMDYPVYGSIINTGNINIYGTATPYAQVFMDLDGTMYTGVVSSTGLWQFFITNIGDGSYNIVLNQILSGSSQVSVTGNYYFSIDSVKPLAPTIITPTNNTVYTNNIVTVSGLAEPNSMLTVTIGLNSQNVWSDGGGAWATQFVLLQNYQYSVSANQIDQAGNTSDQTTVVFSVENNLFATGDNRFYPSLSLSKRGLSDNNSNGFDTGDSTYETYTGKNIRYTLSYNNIGSGVATGAYVYETIPKNTCFTLGSVSVSRANVQVQYSNNNGSSYTYIPQGLLGSQDCAITNIRFFVIDSIPVNKNFIASDNGISINLQGNISNRNIQIYTGTQYNQVFLNSYPNVFAGESFDYNNDGCDDVIALGYSTGSTVYTNDCNGGFVQTPLTPAWAFDGGLQADFNNDGWIDIVGIGRAANSMYYINLSGAGFATGIDFGYYGGIGGSTGDFNNDGYIDIMINGWNSWLDTLLYNVGGTGFVMAQQRALGRQPLNSASADFNKDGWMDSMSAAWQYPFIVWYENTGTGALYIKDTELGTGMYPSTTASAGLMAGDFNNDTRPDFVFLGRSLESYLYINNTTGGFIRTALGDGVPGFYRGRTHDFNNDGRQDFVGVSYFWNTAAIYYNNHDNTFTPYPFYLDNLRYSYGSDISFGDFDNNNQLDFVFYGRSSNTNIAYASRFVTGEFNTVLSSTGTITSRDKLYVQESLYTGTAITYSVYPVLFNSCDLSSGVLLSGLVADIYGSINIDTISGEYKQICVQANFVIMSGIYSPVLHSLLATRHTPDTPYITFDVKVSTGYISEGEITNIAFILSSSYEAIMDDNQDDFIFTVPMNIVGGGFGGGAGDSGIPGGGGVSSAGSVTTTKQDTTIKTLLQHELTPLELGDKIKDVRELVLDKPDIPLVVLTPPLYEPRSLIKITPTTPNIAIKEAIVKTSYVEVGSMVEVKTVENPVLGKEKRCYSPKEVVEITLGKEKANKDLLVYQALLKSYDLTIFSDTDSYKPENGLKRYEAAKMFTNFAKHVLCREKRNEYKGQYEDIEGIDETLKPYIEEAYEYGILRGSNGKFRPLERISRKEFVAALMRMFTNENMDVYNVGNEWDREYVKMFEYYGLDSIVGEEEEIDRYEMSKILYKLYYNTEYEWSESGYVLPSKKQGR